MKLIKSNDLKEGMILGKDIMLESGTLLIACNVALSKKHIENIINLDISYVYILEADLVDEFENKNTQWEKAYHKAFLIIQSVFH
ncbi:hypothetical protein, partial [Anaerosolibacter sp.]|uniref:hypothetical protein n=1 Tax=Anaerosolibacter sp. TaxID=1872527 RepID=UPI0039F035EE